MKLYTAVIQEIKEQGQFSAHQITKGLREKVNDSTIVIDDVEKIILENDDEVANIEHDDVNATIKDIFEFQVLPLKRDFGQGYYLYSLDNIIIQNTGPRSVNCTPTMRAKQAFTSLVQKGYLTSKIKNYIENKKKSKEKVTLHGIQSSLKKKGTKIDDVSNVCKSLGYVVINKSPRYISEVQ